MMSNTNNVEHPSHYADGRKYEPIDVIFDWNLNFCRANALKYISRAGRKDPNKTIEDLEKAIWYLQYEIDQLKKPAAIKDLQDKHPCIKIKGKLPEIEPKYTYKHPYRLSMDLDIDYIATHQLEPIDGYHVISCSDGETYYQYYEEDIKENDDICIN